MKPILHYQRQLPAGPVLYYKRQLQERPVLHYQRQLSVRPLLHYQRQLPMRPIIHYQRQLPVGPILYYKRQLLARPVLNYQRQLPARAHKCGSLPQTSPGVNPVRALCLLASVRPLCGETVMTHCFSQHSASQVDASDHQWSHLVFSLYSRRAYLRMRG